MMEPIKINIKSGVEHFKSLDISEIIEYNGNYHLVLNEDIKDINVGQTIFYIRNIQKDADKYDDITESGEIVEIMDSKNIVITPPPNYIYIIKKIQETDEGLYRVSLSEEHNIFQQDIEESGNQCVYFYDENQTLISSSTSIYTPFTYNDKRFTKEDTLHHVGTLTGCNTTCKYVKIYDYYFYTNNVSKSDILVNEVPENSIYVSFKNNPFSYKDDNNVIKLFTDYWSEINESESCIKYNTPNDNKVKIVIKDSYYRLGLELSNSMDEIGLDCEDNYNSSFIEEIEQSLIPDFIDMERFKYAPAFKKDLGDNGYALEMATGINFYLHFLQRKKITDGERHLNTVYTSGNVYYDSWHVDADNRKEIWWNDYVEISGSEFSETFYDYNKNFGKKSDLIGYLNFTDNDVFYQKKKISQSFLRLSFYNSKDPLEQKLLYYSTIYLDGNELYGKYIKQLNFLIKKNLYNKELSVVNSKDFNANAIVVFYRGIDKEGIKNEINTKISITNEYNKNKSSEGFNLYLFAEDDTSYTENEDRTIYMKVEFNHAGNGKTTPLIMWPKDDEGNFIRLTSENYIDSLFIEVKLSYNKENGKYTYYIPRAEMNSDYNLDIILYEPKLEEIENLSRQNGSN